jgi:formylglycine-generating enzyme required for sulfatase activity/tetratricopeptide (TPR) repeat protein
MSEPPQPTLPGPLTSAAAGERLERAWRDWRADQPPPSWASFLPEAAPLGPDEAAFLVQLDVECRARAGLPALLGEPYFEHPLLRLDDEQQLELIRWEYQQRWKNGERARRADYQASFPRHAAALHDLRPHWGCPRCLRVAVTEEDEPTTLCCPHCGSNVPAAEVFRRPRRAADTASARAEGPPVVPGYEVLELLGQGGMGVVYKARQTGLNRIVALKMIRQGAWAGPDDVLRFRAEAEAAAQLQHPNIVPIYEVGETDEGPFFSLEYVAGGGLDRFLAGAPQLPRLAAEVVEKLARAMHFAHARGILHRDLKPANVLLQAADGRDPSLPVHLPSAIPKITDFGLAKRLRADAGQTQTGAILGTPCYMAPEQAAARKDLGPTADVYALGAILYEMLTGRPPFRGTTAQDTIMQVLLDEVVPPRQLNASVPRDLETICLKCLHKEPLRRYASAGELADDLRRWLAGEPIAARPAGWLERAGHWARRRPAAASLLGVSLLAGLGLAVLSVVALWQWQRASDALDDRERALQSERDARHKQDEERTQRALAQVDALLTADPRAVPDILKDLAAHREDVLPRLRQVWGEPDTLRNRPRRMRAALALLPVEPVKSSSRARHELLRWLREVPDPAELLVVRNVLRPHLGELTADLWRQAEQPGLSPARRLRLLAVLAALGPQGAGWSRVDEQALEALLDDNPLYLGSWAEAFRDVREPLMPALLGHFRGPVAQRRSAAASILADYAGDQPQMLVELATEADDRQLAILFPALERRRRQALPLLRREVEKQLRHPWSGPPLAPWPPLAAGLPEQVERAEGLLAERFALVQALPLARGQALVEALRRSGYRLTCYRPYRTGPEVRVAAVWARDGREAVLAQGLSAEALLRRDAELRKQGLVPLDVSVYPGVPGGEDRHAAVWVGKGPDTLDSRLYAGVNAADHPAVCLPLIQAGYVPRTQTWTAPDGRPPRHCAVWWRPARPITDSLYHFEQGQSWYEDNLSPDRLQEDVRLVAGNPLAAAAAWRETARKQVESAQQALQQGLDPGSARWLRGQAHFHLGQLDRALPDLHATVKQYPLFAPGYHYRALALARTGRERQARKDLAAFLLSSTDADLKAVRAALVLVDLGQHRQGLDDLESALAKDRAPASRYHAARAYARAAEVLEARRAARAAALVGQPSLLSVVALGHGDRAEAGRLADRAVGLLREALVAGAWAPGRELTDSDLQPIHGRPGFRALLRQARLDRRFSAVWHASNDRASEQVHGLSVTAHLARCRELAAQSYRPVRISVAETAAGQPLVTASVWQRPRICAEAREKLARRQAGAGLVLLKLGQAGPVWPLLPHGPYPEARGRLVMRLRSAGVKAPVLVERLLREKDASARRALILALGEYTDKELPAEARRPLTAKLLEWYRVDPDAGAHGAIDWLLRHGKEGPWPRPLDWGQARELAKVDAELAARSRARRDAARAWAAVLPVAPDLTKVDKRRGWYVNGQGQTLAVVAPRGPFLMSSPGGEAGRLAGDEKLHWRRIDRRYAIGTKPVTVAQFRQFLAAHPEVRHSSTKEYSPDEEGPILHVTWYEAAQYCRWLSEQEGLPEHEMVYPPVAEIEKSSDGRAPLRLPANYLKRKGYRLPTEAEWEHACRAGARTSRYYGAALELLPRYAWYGGNSQGRTWPVGQKRPNDLGLFDMHGNAWTWCQDSAGNFPPGGPTRPAPDEEDASYTIDSRFRVLRGGSFYDPPSGVRASYRYFSGPASRIYTVGFRVARTCD